MTMIDLEADEMSEITQEVTETTIMIKVEDMIGMMTGDMTKGGTETSTMIGNLSLRTTRGVGVQEMKEEIDKEALKPNHM